MITSTVHSDANTMVMQADTVRMNTLMVTTNVGPLECTGQQVTHNSETIAKQMLHRQTPACFHSPLLPSPYRYDQIEATQATSFDRTHHHQNLLVSACFVDGFVAGGHPD